MKKIRDFDFVPPASVNRKNNKKMSFAEAAMINVGALSVYMAVYAISKAGEAAVKLGGKIRKTSAPVRREFSPKVIKDHFKAFGGGIAGIGKAIRTSNKKFRGRAKAVGFFTALKLYASDMISALKRNRPFFLNAVNYIVPVASFALLFAVVYNTASTSYGITVVCNGHEIGVVTAESVVAEAQQAIADKEVYYDVSDEIFATANLSIKPLTSFDEIIDEAALADRLEEHLVIDIPERLEAEAVPETKMNFNSITGSFSDDITSDIAADDNFGKVRAYPIEIDGEVIGAVKDVSKIEAFLDRRKDMYDGEDVISVSFDKDVEYGYEKYVEPDQVLPPEAIISKLDSIVSEPVYYEVQLGDNPWNIAMDHDMTLDEFLTCFVTYKGEVIDDITKYCPVGAMVQLSAEVPFLQVEVTKEITYIDTIDYEINKTEDPDMYKGDSKIDVKGVEGEAEFTALVTYKNDVPISKQITKKVIIKEPVTQEMRVGTRKTTTAVSTGSGGSGTYFWPVEGGYISAYMGDGRGHKGLDIATPYGTAIYACESGTVTRAGNKNDGYGNCVMVSHDDGNVTLYGHMSSIAINYGDYVVKGQLIGYVGSTGWSTGNHLHLEVRSNGYYLNPIDYVSQS